MYKVPFFHNGHPGKLMKRCLNNIPTMHNMHCIRTMLYTLDRCSISEPVLKENGNVFNTKTYMLNGVKRILRGMLMCIQANCFSLCFCWTDEWQSSNMTVQGALSSVAALTGIRQLQPRKRKVISTNDECLLSIGEHIHSKQQWIDGYKCNVKRRTMIWTNAVCNEESEKHRNAVNVDYVTGWRFGSSMWWPIAPNNTYTRSEHYADSMSTFHNLYLGFYFRYNSMNIDSLY